METKSISIKQLANRVLRHPMLADTPFETIIDYAVDFFGLVGLPAAYDDKLAVLEIKDFKADLPNDFLSMIQVRTCTPKPLYYRYTTHTFHTSPNQRDNGILTYKIQGGVIYTSNRCGKIEISYQAMAVDECGLPTIPDNAKFLRAIEAYIKVQRFTILFDEGKISQQVLVNAQQEYAFAVGACETEFHLLVLDKIESVANMAKTLLIRDAEHHRGYGHSGDKEYIINHW